MTYEDLKNVEDILTDSYSEQLAHDVVSCLFNNMDIVEGKSMTLYRTWDSFDVTTHYYTRQHLIDIYHGHVDWCEYPTFTDWLWDMTRSGVYTEVHIPDERAAEIIAETLNKVSEFI